MNFLVIGLGSMGKRRIRCLKTLGYEKIIGFDLREDRRKESEVNYDIKTIDDINLVNFSEIDAFIISTPPDKHDEYIELGINNKIPVFVQAVG